MTTVEQWLVQSPLEAADKRVLFEFVTGLDRICQMTHSKNVLSPQALEKLREVEQKRLAGIPVPYITGVQEFYGRTFSVGPSVLIPRPDTECLVEWLIENLPHGIQVCDLGTGSGCIAETLKLERSDLDVLASDLSRSAIETARRNAVSLKADVRFLEGSWLKPYVGHFDLKAIVSNPPYIRSRDPHLKALTFEPQNALVAQENGLAAYREILSEVKSLKFNPHIIAFEHGYDQGESVRSIFSEFGMEGSKTHKDYGGNDRFTVWCRT